MARIQWKLRSFKRFTIFDSRFTSYPATADHLITPVENSGLSGGDSSLRLIKHNLSATAFKGRDSRRRRDMPIAHPHFGTHGRLWLVQRNSVDAGGCEFVT